MFNINHEEKELPSINMSMKLQGYLLGYEVLQGGVIVQSHRYAKPVKNLVVNSGKNALMTVQNSNSATMSPATGNYYPRFGVKNSENSGVLAYCARGTSTTAVTVTDTALGNQIGNKTSTILAGDPHTGTRFDKENGKVIMRITHDHENESADRNINELGWFGVQNSVSQMFSRIVLPSTITVLTGQSLRTIYQLEVTITPTVATSCAPSITGWTTDGDYRWECAFPATSTTFATHSSTAFILFDTIDTAGYAVSMDFPGGNPTDGGGLLAAVDSLSLASKGGCRFTAYGTAQTFNTFGTRIGDPYPSSTVFTAFNQNYYSSGSASYTTQNYTPGNFYRDRILVFEPNWTGYSSINVYAMRISGLMYIFDNPQTKTNTQRLTLNYRISVS